MKILKVGRDDWERKPLIFDCMRCGCKFEATIDEYHEYGTFDMLKASCNCPNCADECVIPNAFMPV